MKKSLILLGALAVGFVYAQEGNVGINVEKPTGTLTVKSKKATSTTSATSNLILQNGAGTELLKVKDDGAVLISKLFNTAGNATNDKVVVVSTDGTLKVVSKNDLAAAGTAGADGKSILNGAGAPASTIGKEGEFYIDTTTKAIYGPKTGTSWGTPVSLVGAKGDRGEQGLPGTPGATGAAGKGITTIERVAGTSQLKISYTDGTSVNVNFPADQNTTYTAGTGLTLSGTTFSANPAGIALTGDVTGNANANTVTKIQGKAVSATAPTENQVLQWKNNAWTPATFSAGAALPTGTENGQTLVWDGTAWVAKTYGVLRSAETSITVKSEDLVVATTNQAGFTVILPTGKENLYPGRKVCVVATSPNTTGQFSPKIESAYGWIGGNTSNCVVYDGNTWHSIVG